MTRKNDTDTKNRILETARIMFAGKGYEAVGIQDICVRSEITKPTLYYYFGNKEGLLSAVSEATTAAFVEALSPITFTGDIVADIRELFTRFLAFRNNDADGFRFLLQMFFPPEESPIAEITSKDTESIVRVIQAFFLQASFGHGNLGGKEHYLAITFLGHAFAFASTISAATVDPDAEPTVLAAQTFIYGIF